VECCCGIDCVVGDLDEQRNVAAQPGYKQLPAAPACHFTACAAADDTAAVWRSHLLQLQQISISPQQ
jgi:hypothetical protein